MWSDLEPIIREKLTGADPGQAVRDVFGALPLREMEPDALLSLLESAAEVGFGFPYDVVVLEMADRVEPDLLMELVRSQWPSRKEAVSTVLAQLSAYPVRLQGLLGDRAQELAELLAEEVPVGQRSDWQAHCVKSKLVKALDGLGWAPWRVLVRLVDLINEEEERGGDPRDLEYRYGQLTGRLYDEDREAWPPELIAAFQHAFSEPVTRGEWKLVLAVRDGELHGELHHRGECQIGGSCSLSCPVGLPLDAARLEAWARAARQALDQMMARCAKSDDPFALHVLIAPPYPFLHPELLSSSTTVEEMVDALLDPRAMAGVLGRPWVGRLCARAGLEPVVQPDLARDLWLLALGEDLAEEDWPEIEAAQRLGQAEDINAAPVALLALAHREIFVDRVRRRALCSRGRNRSNDWDDSEFPDRLVEPLFPLLERYWARFGD